MASLPFQKMAKTSKSVVRPYKRRILPFVSQLFSESCVAVHC
jgi:hypothetical protein